MFSFFERLVHVRQTCSMDCRAQNQKLFFVEGHHGWCFSVIDPPQPNPRREFVLKPEF